MRFARFASSAAARTGKKGAATGDKRNTLIASILYPKDELSKAKVTAGPVSRAEEDELYIERVWSLERTKEAEQISRDLHRKRDCMFAALDRLKQLDPVLYAGAMKRDSDPHNPKQDALRLFPAKIRVPTDTLPAAGWDYHPERKKD